MRAVATLAAPRQCSLDNTAAASRKTTGGSGRWLQRERRVALCIYFYRIRRRPVRRGAGSSRARAGLPPAEQRAHASQTSVTNGNISNAESLLISLSRNDSDVPPNDHSGIQY